MNKIKISRYSKKIKKIVEEIVNRLEEETVKPIKKHTGNPKLTITQGKSVLGKAYIELNNKIPKRIIKYMIKNDIDVVAELNSYIHTHLSNMKGE